jgi:hypothetical protein
VNALILSLALMLAQNPRVTLLPSGDYLVPQAAFAAVDTEMKRLQAVEAAHKGESWLTAILFSAGVGLVVGAVAAGLAVYAAVPKAGPKDTSSPSP